MISHTIQFCSELYQLKRNQREGWRLTGVGDPERLADHLAVTAQLAFVLGEMEGLDGKTCAAAALFHDNGETRTGDQHKVAARYVDSKAGERVALDEQLAQLPESIGQKIRELADQAMNKNTLEGIVARDADLLEMAFQAKIYQEQGFNSAEFIDHAQRALQTKSAQQLLAGVLEMDDFTNCWYGGLKKLTD